MIISRRPAPHYHYKNKRQVCLCRVNWKSSCWWGQTQSTYLTARSSRI